MNRPSRRVAAAASARQVRVLAYADAAAEAADLAVRRLWRKLMSWLREGPDWWRAWWQGHGLFSRLLPALVADTAAVLGRSLRWSYRDTARTLQDNVPQETAALDVGFFLPVLEPELIDSVVYGGDWQQRLAAATRLAPPEVLAQVVSGGLAAGKDVRQIAEDLMPLVNNVRASARRVARTEALRVAGHAQMLGYQTLGDLVIGYQLHATHDDRVRPWHLARDKQIYYVNPGPGQKGMAQMPHPPDEPGDFSERPPGTPATAWNCRCYLTPVLGETEPAVSALVPATVAEPAAATAAAPLRPPRPRFVRHPNSGKDEIMVRVSVAKLNQSWSRDNDFLPTGAVGPSEVKGRREGVLAFLKTGKALQAPRVGLAVPTDEVTFMDGRHRFAVLRDLGVPEVAVMVPREYAATFRQRFGIDDADLKTT